MEAKPAELYQERVELGDLKEDVDAFVPTPEDEAAVIRKLDWHIMPLLFLFYTLSVLDRSNLGNAKLAGLPQSIDLTGNNYAFLATIFYIACTLLHDIGCLR
jgi:hypothetical protein